MVSKTIIRSSVTLWVLPRPGIKEWQRSKIHRRGPHPLEPGYQGEMASASMVRLPAYKPYVKGHVPRKECTMILTWAPGVAMSKEEIDSFLQQKLVARLTSIRPDGYPHTTPLWYVWDGESLWCELGAGARPRQHIRNLRRNPKLCVTIDRDARPEHGGVFDAQ